MTARIRKGIALPAIKLPATKEYRYIEPAPSGLFNPYKWDKGKGEKARAKSIEVRQEEARKKSKESRERNNPKRIWTAEEIEEIKRMRAQGVIWKVICKKYGVSDTACMKAYKRATEKDKGE